MGARGWREGGEKGRYWGDGDVGRTRMWERGRGGLWFRLVIAPWGGGLDTGHSSKHSDKGRGGILGVREDCKLLRKKKMKITWGRDRDMEEVNTCLNAP